MRVGWPHYRGDFVRYRCVQGGHVSGVILCGTDACRVAMFQGDFVRYRCVQGGACDGSIMCCAMCPCSPDTDQKLVSVRIHVQATNL